MTCPNKPQNCRLNFQKSLGAYYWYVKMPRCGCDEHRLEYITFYVQKHIAHLVACPGHLLVRDGPLGAPAYVKPAYWLIMSIHQCGPHITKSVEFPWKSGARKSGPRFTNSFSIAIQIPWKFCFTLTSILIQWSLQNFVHGKTAVLSWHVQKFVTIWSPAAELQ